MEVFIMALYPIQANERDVNGLFKAAATFTGGEGGLIVRLAPHAATNPALGQNFIEVDFIADGSTDCTSKMYGLLDEQVNGRGTMLGKFLPTNADPIGLGVATHLSSQKVSIWQQSGYFMTDIFDIALNAQGPTDGYGEPTNLVPGQMLHAIASDGAFKRGTLTDKVQADTRVRFMGLVDDPRDLFGSFVSPAPKTGMFKEGPFVLIFQE
jgi:hypothetical protein